jgi:hypothetical protein
VNFYYHRNLFNPLLRPLPVGFKTTHKLTSYQQHKKMNRGYAQKGAKIANRMASNNAISKAVAQAKASAAQDDSGSDAGDIASPSAEPSGRAGRERDVVVTEIARIGTDDVDERGPKAYETKVAYEFKYTAKVTPAAPAASSSAIPSASAESAEDLGSWEDMSSEDEEEEPAQKPMQEPEQKAVMPAKSSQRETIVINNNYDQDFLIAKVILPNTRTTAGVEKVQAKLLEEFQQYDAQEGTAAPEKKMSAAAARIVAENLRKRELEQLDGYRKKFDTQKQMVLDSARPELLFSMANMKSLIAQFTDAPLEYIIEGDDAASSSKGKGVAKKAPVSNKHGRSAKGDKALDDAAQQHRRAKPSMAFNMAQLLMEQSLKAGKMHVFFELASSIGQLGNYSNLPKALQERYQMLLSGPDSARFQLCDVEGHVPNTVIDLACQKIVLSSVQKQMCKHLHGMLHHQEESKNLLVVIPTSGGKTIGITGLVMYVSRMPPPARADSPRTILVSMAPNQALAISMLAYFYTAAGAPPASFIPDIVYVPGNEKQFRIAVGTPDELLRHMPLFTALRKAGNRIIFVADEVHETDETYQAAINAFAKITNEFVGLSATVADPGYLVQHYGELFGRPAALIASDKRAVRLQHKYMNGAPVHPWSCAPDDQHLARGLSGPDLYTACKVLGRELPTGQLITEELMDTIEGELLAAHQNIPQRFPRPALQDRSADDDAHREYMDGMYRALVASLRQGSPNAQVVFTSENEEEVMQRVTNLILEEITTTYPQLLEINDTILSAREKADRMVTPEYRKELEDKEAQEHMGSVGGDPGKPKAANKASAASKIDQQLSELQREFEKEMTQIERRCGDKYPQQATFVLRWSKCNVKDLPLHMVLPPNSDFGLRAVEYHQPKDWYKLYRGDCKSVTSRLATALGLGYVSESSDRNVPGSHNNRNATNLLTAFHTGMRMVMFFGTSRFAKGMNMALRVCHIFDPMDKLSPSEMIQMGGRAGRKGMDRSGVVVYYNTRGPCLRAG